MLSNHPLLNTGESVVQLSVLFDGNFFFVFVIFFFVILLVSSLLKKITFPSGKSE